MAMFLMLLFSSMKVKQGELLIIDSPSFLHSLQYHVQYPHICNPHLHEVPKAKQRSEPEWNQIKVNHRQNRTASNNP